MHCMKRIIKLKKGIHRCLSETIKKLFSENVELMNPR